MAKKKVEKEVSKKIIFRKPEEKKMLEDFSTKCMENNRDFTKGVKQLIKEDLEK